VERIQTLKKEKKKKKVDNDYSQVREEVCRGEKC